jgi:hypothetical protein
VDTLAVSLKTPFLEAWQPAKDYYIRVYGNVMGRDGTLHDVGGFTSSFFQVGYAYDNPNDPDYKKNPGVIDETANTTTSRGIRPTILSILEGVASMVTAAWVFLF